MQGVLYLVPNTLGNLNTTGTIPAGITEKVSAINVFIVENLRNARRYLKKLNHEIDIDLLTFHELNEHTPEEEIPTFLKQALNGSDTAIISEAGVPGVADPGAAVVRLAHEHGIRVVPLTGPSSILLSLMASGLNGQAFRFLGYLPVKSPDRIRKIREIEQEVRRKGETQIFIEAPYRNDALLKDILNSCDPSTLLCIAADLTLDSEFIHTWPVREWKKKKPALHKRPAIFLIGS
ncbi:MAG: SAM-dependent methyltransferase [Bacteroidales bacterium]|nr:SAM-dependent methyltransferase [Bacteroidales bacterium]